SCYTRRVSSCASKRLQLSDNLPHLDAVEADILGHGSAVHGPAPLPTDQSWRTRFSAAYTSTCRDPRRRDRDTRAAPVRVLVDPARSRPIGTLNTPPAP